MIAEALAGLRTLKNEAIKNQVEEADVKINFNPRTHHPEISLDEVYQDYSDRKRRWFVVRFCDFVDKYKKAGWRVI